MSDPLLTSRKTVTKADVVVDVAGHDHVVAVAAPRRPMNCGRFAPR